MEYREIAPLKQKLHLRLSLPGSKSITNRAFLCAALARGKSVIRGALISDDTGFMLNALKELRITNYELQNGTHVVIGCGGRFPKGKKTLHLGNAGTATRFLTALMALRDGPTVITGNLRMQQRPIDDLVNALHQLGADITYLKNKNCPPILIKPFKFVIRNSKLVIKVKGDKSSQYISALLMLAPLLPKSVTIRVSGELTSKPYVDVTLAVMKAFGVTVQNEGYKTFVIKPQPYQPCRFKVEGDASAASYWHSLCFLHSGRLRFTNLGLHSVQGDVNYPQALARLGQGSIDMNAMPDVAMTLAVTAPFVRGKTVIKNVANLRIKETDRLDALETEFKKCGVSVKTTRDSIVIHGSTIRSKIRSTIEIQTYDDHRMAMCFTVMGTKIPGLRILDPGCTSKTYPAFWEDLERAYLSPIRPGDKHVVLIGMRCCGKNYLGKRVAQVLRRPFIDLDQEIEREAGMPVTEIVKKKGWTVFRKIEQKICSLVGSGKIASQPSVIATGGGVVLNPTNMRHLKKNAVTIFIFANPPALAERVIRKGGRPALKKGETPSSEIESVWSERRDLYFQYADVVWDNTSGKIIQENLPRIFGKKSA